MFRVFFGFLLFLAAFAHDDFKNLRVVCFGCSTGIGRSSAELLLKGGAQVVLASRSPQKAKDLLDKFPSTSRGIPADAGSFDQIKALAADAKKFFGGKPVTSLIYAPTGLGLGTFRLSGGKATVDTIQEQMNINVNGLVYFVDAFKEDLIATTAATNNLGSVLAVSSVVSQAPAFGSVPYSVAKAAQDALINGLALEFGSLGVRFNSILPAVIKTNVVEDALGKDVADGFFANAGWRHALGRHGDPDECGHLMAFLVSEKASFITGQQIRVDGGFSVMNAAADMFSGILTGQEDSWFPVSRKWSQPKKGDKAEL